MFRDIASIAFSFKFPNFKHQYIKLETSFLKIKFNNNLYLKLQQNLYPENPTPKNQSLNMNSSFEVKQLNEKSKNLTTFIIKKLFKLFLDR